MKKFLAIGAGATVLLVSMLIVLLIAPPFLRPVVVPVRDYILHAVTPLVSGSIKGSIEIGTLQGSLLRAPLIRDLVLRDEQGQTIGRIDEIRLRYDLSALLERRLQIRDMTLLRPDITLVQEVDGSLNLSRAVAPVEPADVPPEPTAGGGLPIEIDLASLHLRDGHMTIQHRAVPGVQTVTGLQAQLRGKLTAHDMKIELQRLQAQALPAQVTLQTLSGTIQQLGGAMRIGALQLQTDATDMRVHGTLPGGSEPASLSLRLSPLDVGELGRILNDETLEGHLQLSLDVAGPNGDLDIKSQVQTPNGSVELSGRADIASTPPQYEGHLNITDVDLAGLIHRQALQSDLNMRLDVDGKGLALADLEGSLRLKIDPSHLGEIQINPSELHVDAASKQFQIHDFQIDTSVAHMTMAGVLDLAGTTDLTYALQANITDLQPLLNVEPLEGTLNLHGQAQGEWSNLTTQGTVEAHNVRYQAHGLDVLHLAYGASQLLTQPRANVQLKAQQARVGTIPMAAMTLDATYDDDEMRFTAQIQQSETYDSTLSGLLKFQDKRQDLHLDTFQIRLDDRTWRAPDPLDIALDQGAVQINAFKLTHEEEMLALTGGIAGANLNDLHLLARQIDLDFIRRLFTLPDLISGEATLEARLTGTLETPRLNSALTVRQTKQKTHPFARLHTTLNYAGQNFQGEVRAYQHEREVMSLSAHLPLLLSATAMPLAERLSPEPLAIQLAIKQPDLTALQRSWPALPELSGTVQGTIDLQGTYAHLDVSADLALEQIGLPGTIERVSAPLHLTSKVIMAPSVPALALALEQGSLNPALHDLTCRVPKLDGNLPSQGQASQSIHLRDFLAEAQGEWLPKGMQASLNRLKFQVEGLGLPATDVAMNGQLTPDHLELTSLKLQLPRSELRVQGRLDRSNRGLHVAVDIPRLELDELPLTLPKTMPKTVQGDVTVRGTTETPQLVADLRYAEGRINADAVVALQAAPPKYNAQVVIDALNMSRFSAALKGYLNTRLTLDGVGFAENERQANLALDLHTKDLAVAPGLTTRLRATMTGAAIQLNTLKAESTPLTFDANGTLSQDQRVMLNYALELKDLTPWREQLALDIAANGRMSGEVTGTLDALKTRAALRLANWQYTSLHGQDVRMDLAAQGLPTSPQATVQARFDGIAGPSLPSSALTLDAQYQDNRGNFDVVMVDGPFKQTRATGDVLLQDVQQLTLQTLRLQRDTWRWENARPVDIVRDSKGMVRLEALHLRNEDQELRLQGHLQPNGPLAAKLRVQRLQIQPTVQAIAPQTSVPDGRLHVDLNLSGTQTRPEMHGTLRMEALQWQNLPVGDVDATVQLQGDSLRHNVHLRDGAAELLRSQGTVGLDDAGKLAVNVESNNFDLARLQPFSDQIQDIAGALNLDLRLAGTRTKPEVYGNLALDRGALQLETTGAPYKDIQSRMRFDGQRVKIENLHVGSSSGALALQGTLQLTGWALDTLDMRLDANEFTAMNTPSVEAVVTADIEASGSPQALTANGSITVPRARIRIDELPGMGPSAITQAALTVDAVYGSGASEAGASENDGSAAAKQDPLPFLQADIKVDIPRNFWLQARGTAIELKGDLEVSKPYAHPFVIGGDVETLRGHATFFGKKFDLQTGVITFTGSEDINPSLDITASHRVSAHTVYVNVEGESKTPSLTLSSDPELEQQDIISLLLFGKTSDRLTESEGTASEKAQQAAANAAAGAAAQAIGRELGIDSLTVKAGNTPDDASVSAGQYITQDLFLSYERQFGKDGGNTVGVEYNLSRELLLKGSSSDLGESALDLLWRRDY